MSITCDRCGESNSGVTSVQLVSKKYPMAGDDWEKHDQDSRSYLCYDLCCYCVVLVRDACVALIYHKPNLMPDEVPVPDKPGAEVDTSALDEIPHKMAVAAVKTDLEALATTIKNLNALANPKEET